MFEKTVEEVIAPPPDSPDLGSTLSRLGETIGNLFSGGAANTEEAEKKDSREDATKPEAEAEETKKADEANAEDKETSSKTDDQSNTEKNNGEKEGKPTDKANATNEEPRTEKQEAASVNETRTKIVTVKEPVTFELQVLDRKPPSLDQIAESIKMLSDLDKKDKAKLARDHARNALESFLLETKDKMYSDEYEKASTEEERQTILAKLSGDSEWLEYESDGADTKAFKDKLSGLTKSVKDVFDRVQEHRERPQALVALTSMLNASEVYLTAIKQLKDQIFTAVEIDTLSTAINDTKKWQAELEALQKETPLYETPKLTDRKSVV